MTKSESGTISHRNTFLAALRVVGGILIFRDSIGTGAVEIVGRMIAFGLVIAGAALIPAPVRVSDGRTGGRG